MKNMETKVVGMIVLAGVIIQILLGFFGGVKSLGSIGSSLTDPVTLIHVVIGISGLGITLFMTNKALKVAATPITKYVMIIASIVILGQVASGSMLLTGMSNLVVSHVMIAYLIVALLVGHAAYAMYYAKSQKN